MCRIIPFHLIVLQILSKSWLCIKKITKITKKIIKKLLITLIRINRINKIALIILSNINRIIKIWETVYFITKKLIDLYLV